jgi:predicted MPP superfamily phosphohydrolase
MIFFYASLIIAISCSLITERTLVGYNNIRSSLKALVFIMFMVAWTTPVLLSVIRRRMWFNDTIYNFLADFGYLCFGFAFIIFVLLIARDFIWFLTYYLSGKKEAINPYNIAILTKANISTVLLAVVISAYGVWEGLKLPQIKHMELYSDRISAPVTVLQINDLHLHRNKSVARLQKVIDLANSLQPDIIAMPGDIIDDTVGALAPHLKELARLQAKYGVFVSPGNHEFYNGIVPTTWQFEQLGFNVLSTRGRRIEDLNIYMAGIPDNPNIYMLDEYPQLLEGSSPFDYKILLAHNPKYTKDYMSLGFNLQLSAHTHGGQIFPFHLMVKWVNKYLSGKYNIGDGVLYISNGAGYWGPPIRILAPSDITLITIKPQK